MNTHTSRQLGSRLLILAGALFLLASIAFAWADRSLFDSDGFSGRVSSALEHSGADSTR